DAERPVHRVGVVDVLAVVAAPARAAGDADVDALDALQLGVQRPEARVVHRGVAGEQHARHHAATADSSLSIAGATHARAYARSSGKSISTQGSPATSRHCSRCARAARSIADA